VEAIGYPLRKLLKKHPDYHLRMVKAERIETASNMIGTSSGNLHYDSLE
jgi:NADH dehydrogenase